MFNYNILVIIFEIYYRAIGIKSLAEVTGLRSSETPGIYYIVEQLVDTNLFSIVI